MAKYNVVSLIALLINQLNAYNSHIESTYIEKSDHINHS